MIYIGKPFIQEQKGEARLVSHIVNEGEGKELDLYYSVDPEYSQFLTYEQADAFVVPLLLRAAITLQDISVDAPVSEKMLHNLRNGVMYSISKMLEKTDLPFVGKYSSDNQHVNRLGGVNVITKGTVAYNFKGCATGTGCSLGVDSLSVIKKYFLDKNCFPSYRITHLTCFNVGAFGSFNTEQTRESWRKGIEMIKLFSVEFGLPIVAIDSNLHECYTERNFNWSHAFLNMGCVLSLQKLFSKYLYATGYSVEHFNFNLEDTAHYEPFLLPHLSTESTDLISADMEKPRSEKIRYIKDDDVAKRYINVCLRNQYVNDGVASKEMVSDTKNCGCCEKCMRTMLQLDFFGCLKEYADVFNLDGWEERKKQYIEKVLSYHDTDLMYADIYSTIPMNYKIPTKTKIKVFINRNTIPRKVVSALRRIQRLLR